MAQIDDLNAATAKLQTDVDTLLAAEGTPVVAPDLSGVIAAVQAIDAQVVAATPPPAAAGGTAPVTSPPSGNPTLPS